LKLCAGLGVCGSAASATFQAEIERPGRLRRHALSRPLPTLQALTTAEFATMFWIVVTLGGLAYFFVKVGVLSVMNKLLGFGFLVALFIIVCLVIVLLWQKRRHKAMH
jgi:hypothetical protein